VKTQSISIFSEVTYKVNSIYTSSNLINNGVRWLP